MFPKDVNGFAIDDQYFVGGSGLLVKPITEKGLLETTVYLPEDQVKHIVTISLMNSTDLSQFRFTTTTSPIGLTMAPRTAVMSPSLRRLTASHF
jgi:hypothetical protein